MYYDKKMIVDVKDEGFNLNITTFTLITIVSCDNLGLEKNYQGI
jgi:hypothetical protein